VHLEILTPAQLAVLDGLRPIPAVGDFYLADGTALALRHGHRRSIDFDFFCPGTFEVQELASALEQGFGELGGARERGAHSKQRDEAQSLPRGLRRTTGAARGRYSQASPAG
jgi:hypothetical protein